MIEAIPDNMFSWNYFLTGDGHKAFWEKKWTSEQCSVLIDDDLFNVRKHGPGSGKWSLERNGDVIASAQKQSVFKRSFRLDTQIGVLYLMSYGAFTRRFFLGQEKEAIANISPRNLFSRKAQIDVLSEELDFPTTVFSFWLVVLCWRRQEGA